MMVTDAKDDVNAGGRCLRRSGDMHLRSGESARGYNYTLLGYPEAEEQEA